jgi:hypothetical protein
MNAVIKPTPRELAEERERLFEEKKREWLFFVEAINEASNGTGTSLHRAFIEGDAVTFLDSCERAVKEYIDACGMNETAESEAAGRKERG